jgi:hypothetical protein
MIVTEALPGDQALDVLIYWAFDEIKGVSEIAVS